jgi:Aspartyl protease/PDZ domain
MTMGAAFSNEREAQWLKLAVVSLAVFTLVTASLRSVLSQTKRRLPTVSFDVAHRAVVPFAFEDNAIVVKVRVNNSRPLKFFFDTGAGISVLSQGVAARLHLKRADTVDAVGTGGRVEGSLATGVSLSVAGLTVRNQKMAVLPLDDLPCEARDIAGFIGYDFIKEFAVEIDYEARMLRLFEPARYHYQGHGELLRLTITNTPRVRARITLPQHQPIEGLFEIDTGSEGALLINSPFVQRHNLLEGPGARIPESGRGVGGTSRRLAVRLESLALGRFVVASPIVELAAESRGALAGTDNDGPLGNVILRRFKVTLDYSREQMWLEPNAHFSDSFESDMSGMEFESAGKDCRVFKVTDVAERSPAAEAGIHSRDEIVAIDGKPAKQFNSSQILKLLMQNGAEHTLILRRVNQQLSVRIKLRSLI